jgi:CBS domain-containing protein
MGGLDDERRGRWQRDAITAGEIMTRSVRYAARDTSAAEIARIMKEAGCGIVPVVDEQRRLVGVVTDRDLVLRVAAAGRSFADTPAGEAMTDVVQAVTPDEKVEDVIDLMAAKQIRRVPVVDRDDRLLGVISMADVATRADHQPELGEALERVSAKRNY